MIVYILAFIFPAAAFFGGAYLIFRGISKSGPSFRFTSGTARTDSPQPRHFDGRPVIYSKIVVEYFTGREPQWKTVFSSERKASFRLSGRPVSMEHSDVRLSKPDVIQGMIQGGQDMFSQIDGLLEFAGSAVRLKPVLGQPARPFIDAETVNRLSEDPKLKKVLESHRKEFIRISGFSIGQGERLCVASSGPELQGSLEHPLLITDEKEDGARANMDEKARLSVLLGACLVAFSFLVSSLLISSL